MYSAVVNTLTLIEWVPPAIGGLFTLGLLGWVVSDLGPTLDYRVVPHVQRNDLGETRTLYKIQERKYLRWRNYESFHVTLYTPLFKTPEEAERKIYELKSRFR